MTLTAALMPFTENQLWLMEKDKLLAQTWGCENGHQLMKHEAKGCCAICWLAGERVATFERGF
jgi:hypothetical protein